MALFYSSPNETNFYFEIPVCMKQCCNSSLCGKVFVKIFGFRKEKLEINIIVNNLRFLLLVAGCVDIIS